MKRGIIILAVLIILGCTKTIERRYSEKTVNDDMKTLKAELDSTNYALLSSTIIRNALEGKSMENVTYADILKDGKRWKTKQEQIEAEQKALAEKTRLEEEQRQERLSNAVVVTCFEKGFSELGYNDYITYKFAIQNKSDNDIRAIKGTVIFTNLFDDVISKVSLVCDDPIKAGEKYIWRGTTDYNQFISSDVAMRNKDLKDMKVVWKPEKILFTDGSSLE